LGKVYNQHTYTSVGVGETGHVHVRAEVPQPNDRTPMTIDCDVCEPYLLKLGWSRTPRYQSYHRRPDGTVESSGPGIPYTSDQLDELQAQEDQSSAAVRHMGERLAAAATSMAAPTAAKAARRARTKA
jgi:hypothetical protein